MRTGLLAAAVTVALGGTAMAAQPTGRIYVGTEAGVFNAQVRVFDDVLSPVDGFEPFAGLRGGVRVAVGDINGDGTVDLVAGAGPGAGPHVKVFDGRSGAVLQDFFAYSNQFSGGVFVAAGDVDGDGFADVVTGAGPGAGPHVKAFSGADGSVLQNFFAFDGGFQGGVRVAVGDVNNDGVDEIIVGAGPGGGPHVKVFDGRTQAVQRDFFAFDPGFLGGVTVATGRYSGVDALFVGAGAGGAPQVKIYGLADGALLDSFLAFESGFLGGVNVGFARVGGRDTLLAGMASRGGTVGLFDVSGGRSSSSSLLAAPTYFNPFGDSYTDGVFVAGDAAVPEPATWAQMILGFALIGFSLRRGGAALRSIGWTARRPG